MARFIMVVFFAVLWVCTGRVRAVNGPYIFDFSLVMDVDEGTPPGVPPVPWPNDPWNIYQIPGSAQLQATYDALYARNWPLGIMLANPSGPLYGDLTPINKRTTLINVLNMPIPRLDFVFDDFEYWEDLSKQRGETAEVIRIVRSHPDPSKKNARIGSYHKFPGTPDAANVWPDERDRTADDAFYRTSGLNIAMPSCYAYAAYDYHTWTYVQGSNVSPNTRSALFWAPLERLSLAKRNLPAGHLLIPWIGPFIGYSGFPDVHEPPKADSIALLKHFRLRGTDGYYNFGPLTGTCSECGGSYEVLDYRMDAWNAWHQFDLLYEGPGETTILNLSTNKTGGLEWSGVRHGSKIAVLISNLGSSAGRVDLPNLPGLPDYSDYIEPGQHQLKFYNMNYTDCAQVLTAGYGLKADLDKDCYVNIKDLAIFAEHWLR